MISGLIDLNTADGDTDEVSTSSLSSNASGSGVASPAVVSGATHVECCSDLWHACAGPLITLPKKGNAVVYCPQGHLEQLQFAGDCPTPADFNLPPHVFCRVLDVKLHADSKTDNVYAEVSLIQDPQVEQEWREGGRRAHSAEDENGVGEKARAHHMFCKTLTASDTSTHGGFSVPRRAAEDCFPPLDYNQQRPSQELVAKDLHGVDYKFRHIYRGQPRRHLLTTGWSAFVNKKKLVCGDAVLFLRGDDGALRLGIRRATQVKTASSLPPFCSQQSKEFGMVVDSISERREFSVFYNPRGGLSEFVVPYNRFVMSLTNLYPPGMRFKLRCETEEAGDRRSMGIVTGINDFDPVRWRGSKWRCLTVRWDCVEVGRQNRVSPWEIERCSSVSDVRSFMSSIAKRTRTGFPLLKSDFPVLKDQRTGASDLWESVRFHKVLQGQEINGFYGSSENSISSLGNNIRNLASIGFCESVRFNRVLQGDRILSGRNAWTHPSTFVDPFLGFQQAMTHAPNAYPVYISDYTTKPLKSQTHQDFFIPLERHHEEPIAASKNSCRLFGFCLTEGSNVKDSCLNGEEQLLPKVGGGCTNESVHQWHPSTDGCLQGL